MSTSTHYSIGLEAKKLHKWAKKTALNVVKDYRARRVQPASRIVLAFTGMSGTTLATALSLAIYELTAGKIVTNQVYVRKQGEDSHGYMCEYTDDVNFKRDYVLFVDDFVDTGATAARVLHELNYSFTTDHSAEIDGMVLQKSSLVQKFERHDGCEFDHGVYG